MSDQRQPEKARFVGKQVVITVIATLLSLYAILYVLDVGQVFSRYVENVQHCAVVLAFFLSLTFLIHPTNPKLKTKIPWYDIIIIILAIAGPLYLVFVWKSQQFRISFEEFHTVEYVLAFVTVLMVLEATKRIMGIAMPLVALFFIIHATFGSYFPGFLRVASATPARLAHILFYSNEGLYGIALSVASTVILMFIIFGQFLMKSGAGDFFVNLALSVLGHVRGGPAKVAVLASAFFGTMTGATTANIATTGVFTIPMMKKIGYRPEFAAAVETVASNGGQIMPPVMGTVAFIMAEWLNVSYWSICVAAFIPAVLYYVAEFIMVDGEAVRLGLKGSPRAECPPFWKTLRAGWFYVLPVVALIFLIGALRYSPQYSALYALAIMLALSAITGLLSVFKRKARLDSSTAKSSANLIINGLAGGAREALSAGTACATAGLIIGSLSLTQLGIKLSAAIVAVAGGNELLLLSLAAAACYVLGMGMSSVPCYMMVVILVAPALLKFGVPPLASHLFVFYWAITSFITPPVAVGSYVAAAIAKAKPMQTGFEAMRLGISTFIVPFMFVYRRGLLLEGTAGDIILTCAVSLIGIVLLSWGLGRNALRQTSWTQSVLLTIAGLLLVIPNWTVNITGAVIGGFILLWQIRDIISARAAATSSVPRLTG